jgi:hypothetical protein
MVAIPQKVDATGRSFCDRSAAFTESMY